jgi:hypothetical protein
MGQWLSRADGEGRPVTRSTASAMGWGGDPLDVVAMEQSKQSCACTATQDGLDPDSTCPYGVR